MHASFSSSIATWQNFYLLAGTASATLIGLLFVSVSLHIDLLGEAGTAAVLSLARRTFTRFILIVVVSLLFLVPGQTAYGLGLPLLALGLVDGMRSLRAARVVKDLRRAIEAQDLGNRFVLQKVLPVASSIGLVLVAATVLAGTTAYLTWMVPIVALILANAATDAWDLMLGLAKYKLRRTGTEASDKGESSGE
jgi:hypothetical protein